jgi:hypothetical protein
MNKMSWVVATGVTWLACLSAQSALADPVNVSIQGLSNSAAAEIFWILDQAGVSEVEDPEGKTFQGDLLSASVAYLNGANYNAVFTIDSDSTYGYLPNRCAPINSASCESASPKLVLGGSVAQELFDDMEKAGEPETKGIDVITVMGTDVVCSMNAAISVSGVKASCAITPHAVTPLKSW